MAIETWLAFVAASLTLVVLPGPTILAVISYSLSHGKRVGFTLVSAVALGDATALTASLLGLGALLSTSAFWFTVVKVVGGLYLLYLGVKLIRSGLSEREEKVTEVMQSRKKLFFNTYLVTALNPKGIVFFIAFLPQFVSPEKSQMAMYVELWILALTFMAIASIVTAAYSFFAGSARSFFASQKASRGIDLVGGSLMSVAGIWALFARRVSLN